MPTDRSLSPTLYANKYLLVDIRFKGGAIPGFAGPRMKTPFYIVGATHGTGLLIAHGSAEDWVTKIGGFLLDKIAEADRVAAASSTPFGEGDLPARSAAAATVVRRSDK
jgi:hypothetical protein